MHLSISSIRLQNPSVLVTKKPKMKFLSQRSDESLQNILKSMNKSTVYTEKGGMTFTSDTAMSAYMPLTKEDFSVFDNRYFVRPVADEYQRYGKSTIEYRNSRLVIDNTGGRIEEITKPVFVPLSKILRKIEENLVKLSQNIEDKSPDAKYSRLTVFGFTEKGARELRADGLL